MRAGRSWFALCAIVALLGAVVSTVATEPTVGIEGHATVLLSRPDYRPLPVDERAPLIVRVDGVTPVEAAGFRYELYFLGLEPGVYPLATFLLHPDGQPAAELEALTVKVNSVLPVDHDGRLTPERRVSSPGLPGYRVGMAVLALLWIAGLVILARLNRRRPVPAPAPPAPPPSLADLLRPLAEAAANGSLDVPGRARLERLLIGYWSVRLGVAALPADDVLPRLKADPTAGALLRAVETWLHSPRGATVEDVRRVLEPYAQAPAPPSESMGA